MLKAGFIGAGFVADFYRKALQAVRGVELCRDPASQQCRAACGQCP